MQIGLLSAATAYVLWGLFPLYFKMLQSVPPMEILMHRMLWSLVFLGGVLAYRKQWAWIGVVVRRPRVLAGFAASALLLAGNWFLYIWSINHDRIIDASLGYFITPLVNVLLGYLLLGERLRRPQWVAVALAALGVLWLAWQGGHPPWIGLALAATFGTYGLLRKTAMLGALEGLSLETLLLFPLSFGYLLWLAAVGQNTFTLAPDSTRWLLAAAGPITAIPLLLFAAGARRIPLATLGLLQYIGPTIQLLLGVLLFKETFSGTRLAGFAVVWSALIVYSADGVWQAWSARRNSAQKLSAM
ncbi:MAG: EamA family transporter RarD [Herminiimonas sp.]|nr:EamA family transporter RarD [Herminiimonas sp.]